MTEALVTIQGIEHVLRGERAQRFCEIMARKMEQDPELRNAGRLQRQNAEAAAFRESAEQSPTQETD